jgi:hypothetical protein
VEDGPSLPLPPETDSFLLLPDTLDEKLFWWEGASVRPLLTEEDIESPLDFFPLRDSQPRGFPVDVVKESRPLLQLFNDSRLLFRPKRDGVLPPFGDSRLLPPVERNELLSLLFFHEDSLIVFLPERKEFESILLFGEGDPLFRFDAVADFPFGGFGAQTDFIPGSGILLGRLLGDICWVSEVFFVSP